MTSSIDEYLQKYALKHGISVKEALTHKIVQEYILDLDEIKVYDVRQPNEMYRVRRESSCS